MNKNIVIVHYNTPLLTECLVRSINLFVKDAKIYIFDNSDKNVFTAKFDNVTIIDNTKGKYINFNELLKKYPDRLNTSAKRNNFGSVKHCYTIDKCIDMFDDGFILLDSDVLLKKDISDIIRNDKIFVGDTETWKAFNPVKGNHPSAKKRVIPYICYINVKKCKELGIKYFNDRCIYGLSANGDSYDTGAYFFEEIEKNGLSWDKINYHDYIVHYKAGSWAELAKKKDGYVQVPIETWLKSHKYLWMNETNESQKKTRIKTNKRVVYTCITGDYDEIIEPKYITSGFDYVCFTDNTDFKSDVWEIKPLPEETKDLPQVKKQRYVKINAHKVLSEYDLSIWVDGNVEVKGDLNKLIDKTLVEDCSIYVPTHPKRNCIYVEAQVCITSKKDTNENINKQIEKYKKEGFPNNYGLLQSNIIIRKHNNEDCIKLMEAWFSELKDGSHRDQLSFNYVSWKNPDIKIIYMDKLIYRSEWFNWLARHKRANKKTNFIVKTIDSTKLRKNIIHRRISTYRNSIYM